MTSIGKRLIKLRKKRNLKQNEAAELIGISKVNLSRYENEHRNPSSTALKKLADFYEVTPAYLQYGERKSKFDFLDDITDEEAALLKSYLQKIRNEKQ